MNAIINLFNDPISILLNKICSDNRRLKCLCVGCDERVYVCVIVAAVCRFKPGSPAQ